MMRAAVSSVALLAALANTLAGQSVHIQLSDSGNRAIPAALVTVLDSAQSPIRVLISDSRGGIELNLTELTGTKLRIERPGYLPFTSGLPRGGVEPRQLTVDAARRTPPAYRATAGKCAADSVGGEAGDLWNQALLGLRIIALTEEAGMLDVRGGRYVRVLDKSGRVQQGIVDHEAFAGWTVPYPGPRVSRLPASGFTATDSTGTPAYLVPAAFVLLSPSFLQSHCIDRIVLERGRRDQVGLGFRPLRDNKVAGVEGVLWLDRASAQPRSVEWDYRDPTHNVPQGARGLIAFSLGRDSLPQVVRWWVRVPQVFRAGTAGELTNVIESGAFVLAGNDRPVEDPEGVFAALGEVFRIDPILVEGARAQRSMTEEGSKHIQPEELLGAPTTHAWDIIRNLRPNWLRRAEALGFEGSSARGLQLIVYVDRVRISCLMADQKGWVPSSQHPLGLAQGPPPGSGGEQCMPTEAALQSVPSADIASVEYVPPIEAGAIYGMGHGYGVVVIHTRRK